MTFVSTVSTLHPVRVILGFAGASVLGLAALAAAGAEPVNTLEIVVGNGPHAGTYKPAGIMCINMKAPNRRYFAVFTDFDASGSAMPSEGAISVSNPDEAGTKWGEVTITFRDKNPSVYKVSLFPRDAKEPLTMTRSGKRTDLVFQGQTKDGIRLRVAATCVQTDEL